MKVKYIELLEISNIPECELSVPYQNRMQTILHPGWHSSESVLVLVDEEEAPLEQLAENLASNITMSSCFLPKIRPKRQHYLPSFIPRSWISSTITWVTPFKFLSTSNLLNKMPVVQKRRWVSLPFIPSNRTLYPTFEEMRTETFRIKLETFN